jgi:hypothetical protein
MNYRCERPSTPQTSVARHSLTALAGIETHLQNVATPTRYERCRVILTTTTPRTYVVGPRRTNKQHFGPLEHLHSCTLALFALFWWLWRSRSSDST